REFNINGDNTAELVIGFIDGDGDIGLDQEDTTGAFCYDTCLYHWNLFLEYYELQNGNWVHYPIDWTDPNAIPFYYRVPDVTPTGQNPALVGEIAVDLVAYFLDISEFDTARFEVTLVDRSLNMSNTVRTRSFLKP
ncbi:MAG: hypothetical protein KDC12_14775, partial [Flavobacteriales bacterium]|nr:hypothetical protein [Flavobacteriales bacterium]